MRRSSNQNDFLILDIAHSFLMLVSFLFEHLNSDFYKTKMSIWLLLVITFQILVALRDKLFRNKNVLHFFRLILLLYPCFNLLYSFLIVFKVFCFNYLFYFYKVLKTDIERIWTILIQFNCKINSFSIDKWWYLVNIRSECAVLVDYFIFKVSYFV